MKIFNTLDMIISYNKIIDEEKDRTVCEFKVKDKLINRLLVCAQHGQISVLQL